MEVQVVGDALVVQPDRDSRNMTIESFLQSGLGLPQEFVNQRLNGGHVWFGNQRAHRGDVISPSVRRIFLNGGVREDFGIDVPKNGWAESLPAVDVLYEDDHLMVIGKPAGLLVHPGQAEDTHTLAHWVALHYAENGLERRVRHVHRLDKDTTGTILYAKHAYSARTLDAALAKHEIQREYVALVSGELTPSEGTIRDPIGRDRHVTGRYRVSSTGKSALTHYRTLAVLQGPAGTISVVRCQLETGRTHQIRVHLASRGCPVLGDSVYGDPVIHNGRSWETGHALHALELTFRHPYHDEWIHVRAPFPEPYRKIFDLLETPLEFLGTGG